jgi:transcriptional regulator with XRE-family HTH domain
MTVNDRIREQRVNKGLIQEEVAKALNIPRTTYSKYEKNINPPYKALEKIAKYFGVTADFLLYGGEPDKTLFPESEVLILAEDGVGGHRVVSILNLPPEEQLTILNIIETYKKSHQK